jgi:hypothetical protein
MVGVNVTGAIYCEAANCEVSDVSLMNPTVTNSPLFYYDSSAINAIVKDVTIIQQTALPTGQVGLQFATAPAFGSGIVTSTAGAAWTAARPTTSLAATPGPRWGQQDLCCLNQAFSYQRVT